MYVCGRHTCTTQSVHLEIRGQCKEVSSLLLWCGSTVRTQVIGFGSRILYLLSYLASKIYINWMSFLCVCVGRERVRWEDIHEEANAWHWESLSWPTVWPLGEFCHWIYCLPFCTCWLTNKFLRPIFSGLPLLEGQVHTTIPRFVCRTGYLNQSSTSCWTNIPTHWTRTISLVPGLTTICLFVKKVSGEGDCSEIKSTCWSYRGVQFP